MIGKASGKLRRFIIEPFLAHKQEEEAYVCIYSVREMDIVLFHHEGGVDIGDVDAKAARLDVLVEDKMEVTPQVVKEKLLAKFTGDNRTRRDLLRDRVSLLTSPSPH